MKVLAPTAPRSLKRPLRYAQLLIGRSHRQTYTLGFLLKSFLVVLLIPTCLALATIPALSLFGFRTMIVTGGSMAPYVQPGDALVIHRTSTHDLERGDVVAFRSPGARHMTSHRIVGMRMIEGRTWLQTKGDSNATPDANLAPAGAVYGTVRFHVPRIGRVLIVLVSIKVRLLLVALPALILSLVEFREIWTLRRHQPSPTGPEGAAGPRREGRAHSNDHHGTILRTLGQSRIAFHGDLRSRAPPRAPS